MTRLGNLPEEVQPQAVWDESRTDIRNSSAYMSRKCRELEKELNAPQAQADDDGDTGSGAPGGEHVVASGAAGFADGDKLGEPSITVPLEFKEYIEEQIAQGQADAAVDGDAVADDVAESAGNAQDWDQQEWHEEEWCEEEQDWDEEEYCEQNNWAEDEWIAQEQE